MLFEVASVIVVEQKMNTTKCFPDNAVNLITFLGDGHISLDTKIHLNVHRMHKT
jgi:hypothetical protein